MPRASKATVRKAHKRRAKRGMTAERAAAREAFAIETSEQAITAIAQDAVLILRRELAHKAEISMLYPGRISMGDCISLLRLTADLGVAAMRGANGEAQADYSRFSPEELQQYAALSLKVASA